MNSEDTMYYLYGEKRNGTSKLVAKFGSEQQMLTYVNYALLRTNDDGTMTFEQKTPLTGCVGYATAAEASDVDKMTDVPFNPTPTML